MRPQRAQTAGRGRHVTCLFLGLFLGSGASRSAQCRGADTPSNADKCARIVRADVVAIDQCVTYNRFGTALPTGMMFVLRRDVVSTPDPAQKELKPGAVILRDGKRPRPIVLRANEGDCLEINFTNLLAPAPGTTAGSDPLSTRSASVHVQGLELVKDIKDDGSWVGANPSGSLVAPGGSITYQLFARKEGVYYLTSQAVAIGAPNQISLGLFGMVIVEPKGSSWYRSQVTRADLAAAQAKGVWGSHGHPVIDYDAVDAGGTPILQMLKPMPSSGPGTPPVFELCRSDLTAIIAGPDHPGEDRWLFRHPGHTPQDNPLYPRTWEPYREFAIIYHDLLGIPLVAPFDFGTLKGTMGNGNEAFAINYGSVAIGTEIWSNRMSVGPAWDALDAKFEEFFLSSWVGGDPALVVDIPANAAKTAAAATTKAAAPAKPKDQPDCPAPSATAQANLQTGPKATASFYPDDPSNVYHSYLNDRVKFRVMHGGANVLHVHHQHAHQWLRTPAGEESKLLDSQSITPGDGFTLEMIYGSGNRNLTPGDSIFHCHFYPHFAGGLWALWRVHDVFEAGTKLERGPDGIERPAAGSRALPDGEIASGTPIPALVPMPTLPMAPVPPEVRIAATTPAYDGPAPARPAAMVPPSRRVELVHPERDRGKNPGYPFFIPGIAGRRAPQPPLDFARDPAGQPLDGGLPRHVVLGKNGPAELYHQENLFDFSRDFFALNADKSTSPIPLVAQQIPEDGTPFEQAAMDYHELGNHPTDRPDGSAGEFLTNGGHRRPGAPYADPGRNPWNERLRSRAKQGALSSGESEYLSREDFRDPTGPKTTLAYKAADIQLDVVFNKKGWHYPQQRISSLWDDVGDVLTGRRRPEPLICRTNSGSLVEYWLTNLLPGYYELDDFQVRTPTDMVGQHIHLVKFDVTSSDGAANGFNYQDGSYGPDDVKSRIAAINAGGGLHRFDFSGQDQLALRPTPAFGPVGPNGQAWSGAQTTIQLWYADQLVSKVSAPGQAPARYEDRTLQSVFTHDHFGPSTHQQVGLYAALVIEPKWSSWYNSETGLPLGGRDDGGPTSWQAMIVPQVQRVHEPEFREFVLEFQDFQLAYDAGSNPFKPYAFYPYTFGGGPLPVPAWGWIDLATAGGAKHAIAPPGTGGTPSIISGPPEPGSRVVNYRSEPIPFRVGITNAEASVPIAHDPAHDLSHAFRSIERQDGDLNVQPGSDKHVNIGTPYPAPFLGAEAFDPYTPLLRAYENDRIHIRALVGAHHEGHAFNIQGVKWPTEPHQPNVGFRSNQVMSISEHFEMNFHVPITPPPATGSPSSSDYLYQASADVNGVAQGLWGLLRAYRCVTPGLSNFSGNVPDGRLNQQSLEVQALLDPDRSPLKVRDYRVVAISAAEAQGGNANGLVYYNRANKLANDPNALVYVLEGDLARIKQGGAIEPLVLRANAGELIRVTLTNKLNPNANSQPFNTGTPFSPRSFAQQVNLHATTSNQVGLHAALLSYDVNSSNGFNVGQNGGKNGGLQTAAPGQSVTYVWYAGDFKVDASGGVIPRPIEYGTVGLAPSDAVLQHPHGLVGVLVVEPPGAGWSPQDARTTAKVTVPASTGKPEVSFQEYVVVLQDQTSATGPAGTGTIVGVNYKGEPASLRFPGGAPSTATIDVAPAFSNTLVTADPQTPIFTAKAGEAVRFRLIHTGGTAYWAWALHGHSWQQSPYRDNSTALGFNPLSPQAATVGPTGALDQADVLIDRAGGRFGIPGDYLYGNVSTGQMQNGMWGVFRVQP
jgi:hypothetical protein